MAVFDSPGEEKMELRPMSKGAKTPGIGKSKKSGGLMKKGGKAMMMSKAKAAKR